MPLTKISHAQMPFHKLKLNDILTIVQKKSPIPMNSSKNIPINKNKQKKKKKTTFISINSFNKVPNIYPTQRKKKIFHTHEK